MNIIEKNIGQIKFSILSPTMIKKMSAVRVLIPDTYDEDGYPIDGGLIDQHMGVIDPGLRCKTCGGRIKTCPGHFGHIELARPILHPGFAKIIYYLLSVTCAKCGKLMINKNQLNEIERYDDVIAGDVINVEEMKVKLIKDAAKYVKTKISVCPHCAEKKIPLTFEAPTTIYEGEEERRVLPTEIKERLERISNDDLQLLGIDAEYSRPEWMVLTNLPVIPSTARPSITLESGERSEDDLTHKLVDILRINQRLEENINAGAPQLIIEDLWELLQYHVTTYFDNETSGIPPARHRSGRPLKTLSQRLKGKEGRFRYNLSGKRVNFSARTVISPDPLISINEVGVPPKVAEELTVPFYVNEWNIEDAKKLVLSDVYPRARYVIGLDERKRIVMDQNKTEIAESLQPGMIVERQIMDGDVAIFNRQPSLHRVSMMCHKVKVLPGNTFRLNLLVCPPYNADFDGDEMNLHIPQTEEAKAEAEVLMKVQDNLISPRHGKALVTASEDHISALFILTNNELIITKEVADKLSQIAGVEVPKPQKDGTYNGRDIFSLFMPKGLDIQLPNKFCKRCAQCKKEKCEHNAYVSIKDGHHLSGAIDAKAFSQILEYVANKYGSDKAREMLDSLIKMSLHLLTYYGLSVCLADYELSKDAIKELDEIKKNAEEQSNKVTSQYKEGKLKKLPGLSERETLEQLVTEIMTDARKQCANILRKHMGTETASFLMTEIGARGNILNLIQLSAFLAQQAVRGRRVKRGYNGRVIPCYAKGDLSPRARGYISSSFMDGLTPQEYYFHAMGGRDSLVAKGVNTQRSGYLQRRLVNALQDMVVSDDLSVRDSRGTVIQFKYGEDGVDPSKTIRGSVVESEKRIIEPYSAVGVVAAQSIGEPGTQMTMRAFHYAGVAEQVPIGLPRLIELVDVKRVPKIPMMDLYLLPPADKDRAAAEKIANSIEEVTLKDIATIDEDLSSKSLSITVNEKKMNEHGMNIETVTKAIKGVDKGIKADKFTFSLSKPKLQIRSIRRIAVKLKELVLKGVPGIKRAMVIKDKDGIFFVRTGGTNLRAAMKIPGVDPAKCTTNNIIEVQETLGIEAARNTLLKELEQVMKLQGLDVDIRHLMLLADAMCASGEVTAIGRRGLSGQKSSIIARAAFEETVKHLLSAAAYSTEDKLSGIIENIIIGQDVPVGTGLVRLASKSKK